MDSSMSKLFLIQDTTQRNLTLQPPEWKVQPNKESQLGFLQEKKKAILQEIKYIASWSMKFIQQKRSSNSWKYKIQVDWTITQPKIVNN